MNKTLLVITTSLIVSACAHRPPPLDMDEIFFETKIKQDGTKLFAFSIPLMQHRDSAKGGGKGGRGQEANEVVVAVAKDRKVAKARHIAAIE